MQLAVFARLHGLLLLVYYPSLTLLYALTIWNHLAVEYGLMYWSLYFLPKILPFYLVAAYFGLANGNHKRLKDVADSASWLLVIVVACFALFMAVSYVASGFSFTVSLGNHDSFDWSYAALIEYPIGFLLAYLLSQRKTDDVLASATFATVLVMFAGVFYEIPLYTLQNVGVWIADVSYPFLLCTNIICGFILLYFLHARKWHPETWFFLALGIYAVHAACWLTMSTNGVTGWFPRAAGLAVLLSLACGFRKKGGIGWVKERMKGEGV